MSTAGRIDGAGGSSGVIVDAVRVLHVSAVLALATSLLAGSVPSIGSPGFGVPVPSRLAPAAAVAYVAPLPEPLRVVRGFDPPADPYGPGHRGVDLDAGSSPIVRAAGAGVVSFAGPVAGRGVIVIAHPDGVSTEYEPVAPLVRTGMPVRAGDAIGRIAGTHPGCGVPRCLHWGARRDGQYIDPLSLLHPLGPVRLLPWPGDG